FVQISTAGDVLLARSRAATDGSFGADGALTTPLALGDVDQETIRIRALDEAGNASAWLPVRNVDWVATLAGKEPYNSFKNPHRLELRPRFFESELKTPMVVEAAGVPVS